VINQALAHGPVIVYFSAREAREETSEETTAEVNVLRTDKSTHRLTLDGMSRYNTDDTHPSWRDYAGPCKLRIKILRGSLSIGCHGTEPQYPMHYVTVRGFEATGSSGRVVFGGNHTVVEHMYIHDIAAVGANLMLHGSVESDGKETFGRLTDITIRNNRIERGEGEGIYVAGNYRTKAYGGWPEYGNTHSDVLIEGNTIHDAGLNGGEGDGIDVKTGLRNVTIRGNTIERLHPMPDITGIICEGVFGDARSDCLIEGNRICGAGTGIGFGGQNGVTVRNNVISNCAHGGVSAWGEPGLLNRDVQICNNTVYGNGGAGIGIGGCTDVTVKSNLVFDNDRPRRNGGYQLATYDSTNITSDYNLFSAPGPEPGWPEGPHSIIVTDIAGLVVDAAMHDLHLAPSSPAIDKGTDLSATGIASDFDGVSRPQGLGWDIGAYERKDSAG
jgi:parallel beta-helix repeat protein